MRNGLRLIGRVALSALALVLVAAVAGGFYARHLLDQTLQGDATMPMASGLRAPAPPPATPPATRAAPPFDWASIADPPMQARPWLRWWWPGADVEPARLRDELAAMRDAGFGGVEIQPFTMGTRHVIEAEPAAAARVHAVDTERYFRLVRGVLADAEALGMRVDLTHYSGWPAGSAAVSPAENTQSLSWAMRRFRGGGPVELALPRPSPGINAYLMAYATRRFGLGEFAQFDAASAQLVSVMVARPLPRAWSWSPLDWTLPLDPASVQVVDAHIRNGRLHWNAPDGDWALIASWRLPTGEGVSLGAFQGKGHVIDILDSAVVRAHYDHAFGDRAGLAPHYARGLRAIFNDSLEFKADRLTSADFLAEFERRRGYDPRPWLPAIYRAGHDNFFVQERVPRIAPAFTFGDLHDRVRHDWQLTLSDLVIERFIDTSRRWSEERGLLSRGQGYGLDIDVIRALGVNHIPETEQHYAGGSDAFLKLTASAAMLYGRPIASAESFGWRQLDYAVTPTLLKVAADRLFAAGINHIVYHGFPHDWQGQARARFFLPVGWNPWSSPDRSGFLFSGNYAPRTAIWADLPALNQYIARAQHLLRQGQPHADVLILNPMLGVRSGGYGPPGPREPVTFGELAESAPAGFVSYRGDSEADDARIHWLRGIQPVLDALTAQGLTWAWVNPHALLDQVQANGRLRSGATYGAILLSDVEAVDPATASALQALAAAGTPVVLHGVHPRRQPGLFDADRGDAAVRASMAALADGQPRIDGAIALAAHLGDVAAAEVRSGTPAAIARSARRLDDGTRLDFVASRQATPQTVILRLPPQHGAWWFDAMTGARTPAVIAADGSLRLELAGWDSRFLVRGMPGAPADTSPQVQSVALPIGPWALTVDARTYDGLLDWRAEAPLRTASRGLYRATARLPAPGPGPAIPGARYVLDAGPVPGSAWVRVNGIDAGRLSLPPHRLDIGRHLRPGENRIEIEYRPPERNALIGAALAGDPRAGQFRDRGRQLTPAGLPGPIRLLKETPVAPAGR